MITCYEELLHQCPVRSNFRERTNFIRVMFAARAMRNVLCSNKSFGLQEITRHSTCIESARRYGYCDDHLGPGVQLLTFFNKMMRFELSDTACQPLANFKHCLVRNAHANECDVLAMSYVTRSLDEWISHFCTRAGIFVTNTAITSSLSSATYFLLPIVCALASPSGG